MLKINNYEVVAYIVISIALYYGNYSSAIPFFILLARANIWDVNFKLIPSYILLGILASSLIIEPYLVNALNGLIAIGLCYIINEIHLNIKHILKRTDDNKAINDGDVLIIGAIAVLFNLQDVLSIICLSVVLATILLIFKKEKELAFIPVLSIFIVLHFFSSFNLFNTIGITI